MVLSSRGIVGQTENKTLPFGGYTKVEDTLVELGTRNVNARYSCIAGN